MMIQSFDPDAAPTAAPGAEPATADAPAAPADRWWLLPALLVLAFGLLIWQVQTHGPVTHLDIRVRDRVQGWARSPSMKWTFHPGRAMADLGNQSVSLSVLVVVTAVTARLARSWRPVFVTLGALATLGTVILIKAWINRPGPSAAALGDGELGFFPSGHTADAVLCYGTSAMLLCVFAIPNSRTRLARMHARRLRQATIAAAIVLVLAVIFGLLWSNFHWLSDTVGSLCWCGAALAVIYRVACLGARSPQVDPVTRSAGSRD